MLKNVSLAKKWMLRAAVLYVGCRRDNGASGDRWANLGHAAAFFLAVLAAPIPRIAVENPIMLGRSWLAFCAGVEHATHVAEAIQARGLTAATIFGDTPKPERDRTIAAFKRGEIRALASMGVLTTGFNAPGVDLIAMLRPTKSAGLYVQMAGRGTRLASGKADCVVLDFAGNVARHGPIDAVKPKRPGAGEGDAPVKVCPDCQSILATAVRVCPDCGHAFPPPKVQVEAEASTLAILTTGKPQWLAVDGISYRAHEKEGGRTTLQVDYQCGFTRHREWVCFEHSGYARQKAVAWWRQRAKGTPVPSTVTEALAWSREIAAPAEIAVRPQGRFTEIVSVRFAPCPPASVPSAAANPVASAGSTQPIASRIPAATSPGAGSAAARAKTSTTGAAA